MSGPDGSPAVQQLADYSVFGHPLHQRPTLDGRLRWASTETATQYAGHIEGALTAAERAARALMAAGDVPATRPVATL